MSLLGVKPDLRTREAKAAQEFMSRKGYPQIRPVGVVGIPDDSCWYFYYRLPEGVLELEVIGDPDGHRFTRKVTSFVTDPERVQHLLAS